jgi:hypothetical protein
MLWRSLSQYLLPPSDGSKGFLPNILPNYTALQFRNEIIFTVIVSERHSSFIVGATRSTSIVDVYYRLWRQIGTIYTTRIPSQGNTKRWPMSVRKSCSRSAVLVLERFSDCLTPELEMSLSGLMSHIWEGTCCNIRCTSLSSWLSPRSPRQIPHTLLLEFYKSLFKENFSASVNLAERKLPSSVTVM